MFSNRQRLDVVLVFCCFERDSRGSNLVPVWLNQALWQHGTQCLFWSTWQPEAPVFISLSHCLSVSCHIFVGLKAIFPLLLSPVVSVLTSHFVRTEENAFVSVSLNPSPFPSFDSTETRLMLLPKQSQETLSSKAVYKLIDFRFTIQNSH